MRPSWPRAGLGSLLLPCMVWLLAGCAGAPPSGAPTRVESRLREIRAAPGAPGLPRILVLVSVATLTPARHARGGPMPTLAALARGGIAARRMEPVVPDSPYPVHASLVTGLAPRDHGILGDRLLTESGLGRARPDAASAIHGTPLWRALREKGGATVALDWPTTRGAPLQAVLPDLEPAGRGGSWVEALAGSATPWLLELARAAPPAAARPGPARDRLVVDAACTVLRGKALPRLLLLRLRGAEDPALRQGTWSEAAERGFAGVDRELARLLACLQAGPGLEDAALVVVGDRALRPVHTEVRPNRILRDAQLLGDAAPWQAIVRSHGATGFVYARDAEAALAARSVLETAAERSQAFRVVSAEELIERGADPQAWFGLEARPGFVLGEGERGPALSPAAQRAVGGSWNDGAETAAFVAWGRGLRRRLVVPTLDLLDVAPTLARLLGLSLPEAPGRTLIGLLRLPRGGELSPQATRGPE